MVRGWHIDGLRLANYRPEVGALQVYYPRHIGSQKNVVRLKVNAVVMGFGIDGLTKRFSCKC